jgi:hypothetical protein
VTDKSDLCNMPLTVRKISADVSRGILMRRLLTSAAIATALLIPASVATVALAGQAGAAVTITCTSFTGTVSGNSQLGGCTGGNTGGGSLAFSSASLATGGTIHWLSGGSITIGAPTLTATSAKKCPGYVKNGASNPTADKVAGAVTADVGDGIKIPGKLKGEVCISSSGNLSALKPLTAK